MVTNFMGTSFLLAILGGFLSDAFITTYNIFLISAATEFMGLLILTVQAREPSLQANCSSATMSSACNEAGGRKAAIMFTGLYLVALGVGGIKGSLPPHGAEQFDEYTANGRKQRSNFFNYYVFCLSCGALIAVTFVVWIEDNIGWQWGFGVSTASILMSALVFFLGSANYRIKIPTGSPIFASTIMLNCCLAQLSTFSVQQAATMNTKLGSLKVPPASLPVFPVIFIMILALGISNS